MVLSLCEKGVVTWFPLYAFSQIMGGLLLIFYWSPYDQQLRMFPTISYLSFTNKIHFLTFTAGPWRKMEMKAIGIQEQITFYKNSSILEGNGWLVFIDASSVMWTPTTFSFLFIWQGETKSGEKCRVFMQVLRWQIW